MQNRLIGALALCCVMTGSAAMADDPNDPAMRSKAARARDHAIIRSLNQRELAHVRARDARWARENAARRAEYERAMARYRRDLARWRGSVAACRAGNRQACEE